MKLSELMSEDSKQSMMRFAVFATLMIAGILGIVLGFVLVLRAVRCDEINWTGCALFLGAIATTITGALGMKAYQKGKEKKE